MKSQYRLWNDNMSYQIVKPVQHVRIKKRGRPRKFKGILRPDHDNQSSLISQSIPIPELISAQYLLKSLNDNAVQKCYQNIIESLNKSTTDIILMLIKASTIEQFKNIYHILQSSFDQIENLKQNEKKNNNNYFDNLASSTIYNICEFLDRNDMSNFKLCSMSISLIIFEIMKCIAIGIINMNELITNKEYKYCSKINIFNKIKVKRIKPFTKYKSLMNLYQNKYNISFDNMLVLKSKILLSHNWNRNINQLVNGTILNRTSQFESKIENYKCLFIFDKSKIVNLSSNPHQYNLYLLQYYDRNHQRVINLDYILLRYNK